MGRQGLEWSIQEGQLQVLPPDEGSDEDVVVLSAATGLIGTINKTKVVNQSLLTKKDGKLINAGISCTSLLNPDIRPGRRIKIESSFRPDLNGIYRVIKVKHTGDTHAQPWYSEIEAR